ncbi:hypothetical protein BUALT_Bualt09G0136700 [Buddleja alternifolia]|uniref:DUF7356 domain-containing protein n=1 Tax=Buddleja alternifolia TaxID=168488 RepID=A0AAV6X3R6_9LAMI|nr:hypothetical protein BUALT_Bualt09G0136700 [Buddleja alternifolia]
MDKNGVFGVILIFVLVSNTCNASFVFHLRKLITSTESNNGTTTSQVSPTGSPVNESNTNPTNAEKSPIEKHKESQMSNQKNNETSPADSKSSKKNDNDNENSAAPSLPAGKNGDKTDIGNGKATNGTTPNLDHRSSCEGSLTRCRDKEMLACIEPSKDNGSKEVFLVLQNDGESTFTVNINLPNTLKNALPALEVPKHETRRMDISSIVGKSTELIVNSGNAKCVLYLVNPVSVDNLIQQLSFYSKQVTPIYAVYAFFLLALLSGGMWACCKLREKNNRQDGIPYQELEMGLPESASAVNVDVAEGWDHDWDDDDWDEDSAVKSPSGNGVRSVSADGLTSRSSKKDGWENNWDD